MTLRVCQSISGERSGAGMDCVILLLKGTNVYMTPDFTLSPQTSVAQKVEEEKTQLQRIEQKLDKILLAIQNVRDCLPESRQ
jgi:hypothetical protein